MIGKQECDCHGDLQESERHQVKVKIKSMTKPQCEESKELKVECRQPEEISQHQASDVRLKYYRGKPDQNRFDHKEAKQPPIGLEKVAAPYLPPSIPDCDNETIHRSGRNAEHNNGVQLHKRNNELVKYAQKNTILLVVIGVLSVSIGKSLALSVLEFMGVALFFSGLGLFVGAEITSSCSY
jgi:hypothetical protein